MTASDVHEKLEDVVESRLTEIKRMTFISYDTLDFIRNSMKVYAELYNREFNNVKSIE